MAKKSTVLLIDFTSKGISTIVKNLNKTIEKRTVKINRQFNQIRKVFIKYEEPFCEIRQNHKGMHISLKLPDVKKKDIFLNVTKSSIEVKADALFRDASRKEAFKTFHRIIDLPSCSLHEKTSAQYKNNKLKIKIPYGKIKRPNQA